MRTDETSTSQKKKIISNHVHMHDFVREKLSEMCHFYASHGMADARRARAISKWRKSG